jgi:hypothetical protein
MELKKDSRADLLFSVKSIGVCRKPEIEASLSFTVHDCSIPSILNI